MQSKFDTIYEFLKDIERLKLISRRAFVSDLTRRETSAEHCWHMALGMLTVSGELNLQIDVAKAVKMVLVHDLCEVDAGDISIFDPGRAAKADAELACIMRIATSEVAFAQEVRDLWLEYEAQETVESRWVRVLDRLMPFLTNLMTECKTWREQGISRSQVLQINEPIRIHVPELYEWMVGRVEECVQKGWLCTRPS